MILNFQGNFVPMILRGTKRSTIRKRRKDDKPSPGDPLHMYTGLRKSGTTKVGVFTCEAVTPVSITADGEFMLDGKPIPLQTLEKMAKVDGFESADRFIAFFRKTYGFPFEDAVLIEWNPNSWRWGGNDRAEDKALVVDFLRMNNPDLLELEPAEEKS